jgi:CRISPR/Cas system-associated exonuclease Cas4 (RecB family)
MISNFITDKTQFSWSMMELYNQCPFKFYQSYGLKNKEPANIFGLYGCAFHNLLNDIYYRESFSPNYAYTAWKKVIQKEYELPSKNKQYENILEKDIGWVTGLGFKHIKNFFEIAKTENLLKPAVFTEKEIRGSYKKHKVVAKIDLGINTKYGLTLLDWKTGEENKKDFYQLGLYAALVEKKLGQKIEAVAPVYVKTGKIYYRIPDKELKKETSEYINKIYQAILSDNEFKAKENTYCKTCYLKEICPL